ncbi:MAG: hypothetical protein KJ072_22510 [Verrucomicrobia bacterium]|nr:hypothetical protein [Verrucomicrobiota bacterium]
MSSVLAYGWKSVWGGLKQRAVLRCPDCGGPVPLNANRCPNPACGAPITVASASAKPVGWWRRFCRFIAPVASPILQWGYFLISAVVLWQLLAYAERHHAAGWLPLAGLSVVYLAVLTLLARMLISQRIRTFVTQRAAGLVKLGLICNYFSVLVLMQIAIATWWARALTLAGLFGITWVGLWIFRNFLEPMFAANSGSQTVYDPMMPQGRRGRWD